jgi:hypothetical protein
MRGLRWAASLPFHVLAGMCAFVALGFSVLATAINGKRR